MYPHGLAGCSKDGAGFIKNLNRARRISQKLLAFLVLLPTVLQDYVPELREGIRKFVLGLKILEGRCLNARECVEHNVEIGSRPLFPGDLEKAETLIIEGLSMLEGKYQYTCAAKDLIYYTIIRPHTGITPIESTPPVSHVFVHYPELAKLFGVLKWYWLMVFERFNKKIKSLVGNKNHPLKSVANAMIRDAGVSQPCHHTTHRLFIVTTSPHTQPHVFYSGQRYRWSTPS